MRRRTEPARGRGYAVAGVVTGAYTLANGISSPVLSRIVDRYGQTVVLLPTALAMLVACAIDATISTSARTVFQSFGDVMTTDEMIDEVLRPAEAAP